MANLNKVMLIGRLTRDVETRVVGSGSELAEFGLAINRAYTVNGEKREETTFVDVTAWGSAAETLSKYLKKGDSLFVEGRLKLDQWEDREGNKRSKISVVLDRFQFLGSPRKADGDGDAGRSRASRDTIEPGDFTADPAAMSQDDVPF